jgi:hypothetical protein
MAEWQMAGGRWQWQVADGRWQMADGRGIYLAFYKTVL